MEVSVFIKQLQKTTRNFEKRCRQEGAIVEPVRLHLGDYSLQLETAVEDENGYCSRCYLDADIDSTGIEPLYFKTRGMVYDI